MENTEINQATEQTERTFTQAELNAIVQERIGETKAKYGDYEELREKAAKFDEQVEASKSDLQKATERADALQAELESLKQAEQIRNVRDEVANAKGIPASLLTGTTVEECESQADAMLAWAKKPAGYPKVPDGGDPISLKPAREQFADWFNSQV